MASTPETAVVTGGAGFIGSHLVDALLAEGTRVVVVDDLSGGDSRRVADEASLEVVDIVDMDALEAVIRAAAPAVVYHLAAQASVTSSVADPGRDCRVNVQGTLNLLEACRRQACAMVFTSTGGALYGNGPPLPTPEDFIPEPLSPYGASKWAGEAYVSTWARSTGAPHAICRLGNVYGPRQSPHGEAGVVSIFSLKLWAGERPTVFGHGRPSRDYVHVSDVVEALLRARGNRGVFNIGTAIESDVASLLRLLLGVAGKSIEPELAPLRPGELERSCLDCTRAAEQLGWAASVPLEEGLTATYSALVEEFEAGEPIRAGTSS